MLRTLRHLSFQKGINGERTVRYPTEVPSDMTIPIPILSSKASCRFPQSIGKEHSIVWFGFVCIWFLPKRNWFFRRGVQLLPSIITVFVNRYIVGLVGTRSRNWMIGNRNIHSSWQFPSLFFGALGFGFAFVCMFALVFWHFPCLFQLASIPSLACFLSRAGVEPALPFLKETSLSLLFW